MNVPPTAADVEPERCAELALTKLHSLAGKDYFTVPEAAYYAGISISHWRTHVQREFPPGEFYGKLLYRRSDVQRFIESKIKWPRSTDEAIAKSSTGRRMAGGGATPLARSMLGTPRPVVSPKSLRSRPANPSSNSKKSLFPGT